MKKCLFILIFISIFLTGCASSLDPSEAYKSESSHEIFVRGKEALQGSNYSEAIKRFEALDVQYPFGCDTEQAQLFLIYAYYMKEDYLLAEAAADHFTRMHPTNPNVDYAYYMKGIADYYQNLGMIERYFAIDLAKRDRTQIIKAYTDFTTVTTSFPNSYYTPSAYQYMVYLRNVLANHELQVAEYYYDRQAYMAAVNRAAGVVAHYQGAPAVVDALVIMAKAYHKLKLTRLEQDTLLVLGYNYPNKQVIYN